MKRIILISLLLLVATSALADSGWILTTGDFKQQPVSLEAMDAGGVRVVAAGSQQAMSVSYDTFLQLERTTASSGSSLGKFTLFLAGGDRIQGQPVGYKDEQVQWRSPAVGELAISLKRARALVRAQNSAEELDQVRTDDKVLMNNGDSVKGIITNIDETKVTIQTDSAVDVPLDSVKCIYFAVTGKPQAATGRAFRVRLADGSVLTASEVRVEGQNVAMNSALSTQHSALRPVPLSSVAGIEQLNGPVSWLSSRQPEQVVQLPYFGATAWPTRMDATVGGRVIQFSGRSFGRGIGVHAYSRLDYALDGGYEAFRTQYAIAQDEKRQYADVTVRIKLDGKVVHEQRNFRAEVLSPVVLIDLPRDAKMLTLEVDYGAANDTQDRFNWIEPAFLRHKPPAPATRP